MISIGEMRNRITFQKVISAVNENGFETEDFVDYKTVWAAVSNLNGREFFAAAQANQENTVKFTIRYMLGLEESMRIIFQDKVYNITAIDNIKYKNRYIEIKAMEVKASG